MRPLPVWFVVGPLLAFGHGATAQGLAQDRAPRFLLALDSRLTAVDVDRAPLLGRRLSLSLDGATIKEALGEIGRQSGLRLAYGDDLLPPDARVHLRAEGITVVAALTDVLFDTDVDVVFSPSGRATLVRRPDRTQGGTVAGRVTDAKSGNAIPNVSVLLEGTGWRATTGEQGAYRLVDVTAGTYTLTASRIGYSKQRQSVTVVAGQVVTVDLVLQVASTELEELVVTGTVAPTERSAVPTPISVVTADQIEQKGYQRVDQIFRGDIPGALAWDPGAGGYVSDISIRGGTTLGFGANVVKTYLDGVEVAVQVATLTIDPNSIERIEVLRGPQGSTIYGSEALSGVMQIFTKKGAFNTPHPQVEAKASGGVIESQWGNAARTDNSLTVSGGGPDFSYRLGGGYIHSGDWVDEAASKSASVYGSVRGTQGPATVALSARYYDRSLGQPINPPFQNYTYFSKPFYQTNDLRQQTYGLTLHYVATPRWQHNVVLGYDRSLSDITQSQPRFTTPADSFLFVISFDQTKTSVAYNTTYTMPLGTAVHSSLTAGVDHWAFQEGGFGAFTATQNINTIPSPNAGYRYQFDNTGYFAQAQFGFRDALFLTAGLRAEDNTNFGKDYGLAWAPRMGASYVHALGDLTVKARVAYGDAIRPPFPGAAKTIVTPNYTALGNPNLGPQRQRGTDGGLELYFGGRWSLEATYYNQSAIDLIAQVVLSGSPFTFQNQNVGRIRNKGWEFQGRVNSGQLSLSATYSIPSSVVENLSSTYRGDLKPGDDLLNIPGHTAGATLAYSLPRTVVTLGITHVGSWVYYDYVALYGYYYGGQAYRGSMRAYWISYPAFTKFNLSVSQTLTSHLSIFLQSDNLTNENVVERGNYQPYAGRATMVGVRTKL